MSGGGGTGAPDVHIGYDVRGLTNVYRDLHRAGPQVAKEFIVEMKKIGNVVADQARSNIGSYSPRIGSTVRVVAQAGKRSHVKISVRAGGKNAPHAAAFENMGKEGTFRHPVFGNRNFWVSQDAHPYLLPALRSHLEELAPQIRSAVDRALAKSRL